MVLTRMECRRLVDCLLEIDLTTYKDISDTLHDLANELDRTQADAGEDGKEVLQIIVLGGEI